MNSNKRAAILATVAFVPIALCLGTVALSIYGDPTALMIVETGLKIGSWISLILMVAFVWLALFSAFGGWQEKQ